MTEETGKKINQSERIPGDNPTSDQPFSQEHIDGLSDLISDSEIPDEDTGKFKLPISND